MNISTSDPAFREQAARWFSEQEELLALFQYAYGGGSMDFLLFGSFEGFNDQLRMFSPQTRVTLFREAQLPVRGTVNKAFISDVLKILPDGSEYLCLSLEPQQEKWSGWSDFSEGANHEELREDLSERWGKRVAVGLGTPWPLTCENAIVAYIPGADGVVKPGAY